MKTIGMLCSTFALVGLLGVTAGCEDKECKAALTTAKADLDKTQKDLDLAKKESADLEATGMGALALIAAGQLAGQAEVGESLALTVIVADTIVAVVGLALAVRVRRHFGTLDVRALSTLKR